MGVFLRYRELHRWWILLTYALVAAVVSCTNNSDVTTTGRIGKSKRGAVTLKEITVTASNTSPSVGNQFTVTATGEYSDASTKDLTSDVTWSVSSPVLQLLRRDQ